MGTERHESEAFKGNNQVNCKQVYDLSRLYLPKLELFVIAHSVDLPQGHPVVLQLYLALLVKLQTDHHSTLRRKIV